MRTVIVNGDALTVQDVIDVARGEARAGEAQGCRAFILRCTANYP